ncbi:MAG TPA: DnaA/Hda family protein, partial [Stellaceae bacterium]|nr:DnaA/Hda family protein [Stellaceae bacterium]
MAEMKGITPEIQSQWARIRGRLRDEVGDAAYRSWLKSMTLAEFSSGRIRIAVPTKFLRDWVATHYASRIRVLWTGENSAVAGVDVIVVANGAQARAEPEPPPAPMAAQKNGRVGEIEMERAEIGAPLDPRFTFDNFIVGKPNEFAHAAARRVAECCVSEAQSVPFNPLYLYGGVGLGKTHLMHAIAWHIRTQHPRRKVIYMSAEKFMYQFVRALRFKDTVAFKEQFRSVDALMIDDVQF